MMMRTHSGWIAVLTLGTASLLQSSHSPGQTPEQTKIWEAQRAQTLADEKAKAAQQENARKARKADPMGWVRTLNPMSAGGWEFRSVGEDGSTATFSTNHQLKRSGKLVTIWLRREYAEPQESSTGGGAYLSDVEKVQYDCSKERARPVIVIYYSNNNISGSEQSEEADPKKTPWEPIIPGTQGETNFQWACAPGR
jgi:hypothetical protein